MTERDQMIAGGQYDSTDLALVAARFEARRLTAKLAALDPAEIAAREAVLAALLGGMGPGSWIEAPFFCDYGAQIRLGARVFINMACVFLDPAPITLGDDVQVGPAVQLLTADHPRDSGERATGVESARPITVGDRVWLGGGVIVLPGVEIGRDAVIGAGSVVTRSVPAGVVAAGNPCRVIADPPGAG